MNRSCDECVFELSCQTHGHKETCARFDLKPMIRHNEAAFEQHRRLVARDLDTTGDLFSQIEAVNPLFATPTPKQ